MDNYVINKVDTKLQFPIIDIGQFDKKTVARLQRQVKNGKIVKYTDYTFPKVKNGYAIRKSENSEAQGLIESLKSLFNGSWIYVPKALMQVEHEIITRLNEIKRPGE